MLIELTQIRSGSGEGNMVKVNPLFIVLVREAQDTELGETRVEFLTASDNRTKIQVSEKVDEVEEKIGNSDLKHFLISNIGGQRREVK